MRDGYSVPGRPSGSARDCSLTRRAAKRASTWASGSRSLNSIGPQRAGTSASDRGPPARGSSRRDARMIVFDLVGDDALSARVGADPIAAPTQREFAAVSENDVRTWEAPSLSFARVRWAGHRVSGSRQCLVRASTRAPDCGASTYRRSGPVREHRSRPDRENRRPSLGHTNRVIETGPRHAKSYLGVTVLHTGK